MCEQIITARNEVGARLYFQRHLWFCSQEEGLSQHALQVVSQHALQQVSGGGGGGIPVCLAGFQAHSLGGSWGGSGPGPQPRGKLRGTWSRPQPRGKLRGILSRPTAKGDVKGDLARGWSLLWGGLLWGGACSGGVPVLGGGVPALEGMWRDTPTCDGYCCGRYASYWNAFLLYYKFNILYFLELSKQGDAHHNNRSACVRARRVLSEFLWKYSTGKIIWLQEVRTHVKYLSLQETTNNVSNKAETKRIIS